MSTNYDLVYIQGHQYLKFTDVTGNHRYVDSEKMLMEATLKLNERLKDVENARTHAEENTKTQTEENIQKK